MTYCPRCEARLTETDYEAGACTQCGRDLIDDGEEWEDDALLQADHELIRDELSKC